MSKNKPVAPAPLELTKDAPQTSEATSIMEGLARKQVEAPPITNTIKHAKAALKQAQKVKKRRHRCFICDHRECPYGERIDIDTGEYFKLPEPARDLAKE